MSDLKKSIEDAKNTLKQLNDVLVSTSCPDKYDDAHPWRIKAGLHRNLSGALQTFECRERSCEFMKKLRTDFSNSSEPDLNENMKLCGTDLPCFVVRSMAISSYLTLSWSVYDMLVGVIGKLIGTTAITKEPMSYHQAKLFENFIGCDEKDFKKFDYAGVARELRDRYTWPITCSYMFRNVFVHDGGYIGGLPILEKRCLNTAFNLVGDGFKKFNESLKERLGKIDFIGNAVCDFTRDADNNFDFIENVNICNDQVDECVSSLLDWAVEVFKMQVKCFVKRG